MDRGVLARTSTQDARPQRNLAALAVLLLLVSGSAGAASTERELKLIAEEDRTVGSDGRLK